MRFQTVLNPPVFGLSSSQVALAHNQAGSHIMVCLLILCTKLLVNCGCFSWIAQVNPNPLQWGRAAAITTFDLGSMMQPAPNPWTCTNGHALWPVLLMPDERYSGGWECDVCDRSIAHSFSSQQFSSVNLTFCLQSFAILLFGPCSPLRNLQV